MANVTKQKRDEMIKFLEELKNTHSDDSSIRAFNEIENALTEKKFGLVFEEHTEEVDEKIINEIPVFCADEERKICKDKNLPYNFIIEGDNLQALYLLEKTHRGKVDCIYIDPPYNTGARDWKYNNDYVDGNDNYRHSKWLSMMKSRLLIAKKLLNPKESTLICTIDEKEYLHLGCLLEEIFPEARIQMVSINIHPGGVAKKNMFARSDEYAFYVFMGTAGPNNLELGEEWLFGIETTSRNSIHWRSLLRAGSSPLRINHPLTFYPIFVNEEGTKVIKIGDPLPRNVDRNTIKAEPGTKVIWPIRANGDEGRWQIGCDRFKDALEKGYIKLGGFTDRGMAINYLASGEIKKVEDGLFKIIGHNEDGSIIVDDEEYKARFIPTTQWNLKLHDALRNGSNLINKILCNKRFDYPKSLYAVKDCIKFVVANKPDAIIVDFFAGSGTTQHAVNLINAEDNGNRKCIMVTNNEISVDEEKRLTDKGYKKGDEEWEKLGIAKYVTWPRTYCSIYGIDTNGDSLDGEYNVNDINGNPILMSEGFNCNIKYFKCDWIPRKPQDYLLSNALCLHVKEMIELEHAMEVDNEKNVIIFNRDDYRNFILDEEKYNKIINIWVNQNVIFDSEEIKKLSKKGFKYIPKEYFGQELKEAAE